MRDHLKSTGLHHRVHSQSGRLTDESFRVACFTALFAVAHLRRSIFGSVFDVFHVDLVEALVICVVTYIGMTLTVRKIQSNNKYILPEKALVIFGLMLFANLLLATAAPPFVGYDPMQGLTLFCNYIFSIVIPYFIIRSSVRDAASAERLIFVAIATGVVMSAIILSGVAETGDVDMEDGNVMGIVHLPLSITISIGGNTMALYLMTFVFMGYAQWLASSSRVLRLCGMLSFLASSIAVISLSTRAVLIIVPVGLILLTLLLMRREEVLSRIRFRRYLAAGLLLSAMFVSALLYSRNLLDYLPSFQQEKIGSIFIRDTLITTETLDARILQYPAYREIIATSPIGNGISTAYPDYAIPPHSLILALLLRSGWCGFISYLFFLVGIARYWYQSLPRASPQARPILAAMIVLNICLMLLSWGYDFMNRFGVQMTYFMLCALTTVIAMHASDGKEKRSIRL